VFYFTRTDGMMKQKELPLPKKQSAPKEIEEDEIPF